MSGIHQPFAAITALVNAPQAHRRAHRHWRSCDMALNDILGNRHGRLAQPERP